VRLSERAGRLAVFGLIIAGITFCLVRDPGTGDVAFSISWITRMPPVGPFAGYGLIVPVHDLGVNYPPLSILALWASLRLGAMAGLSEVLSYKAGIALFTLASVLLVLRRDRSIERAGLLFVLTAPFGLLLGYYDVVYLPFFLIALWAGMDGRWGRACAALALASLVKWQPLILAPVFAIGMLRASRSWPRLGRDAAPAVLVVAAVLGLFGWEPTLQAFRMALHNGYLSGQAVNAGWFVSWVLEAAGYGGHHLMPDGGVDMIFQDVDAKNVPSGPGAMARDALRLLFWGSYVAVMVVFVTGRATPAAFIRAALAASLAQFTWNVGVHENHLFVPMIVAYVGWAAEAVPLFYLWAIASLGVFNMIAFYGTGDGVGFSRVAEVDGTVLLAAASVVLFFLVCSLQWKASRGFGSSV
jgi:hypothetical protein